MKQILTAKMSLFHQAVQTNKVHLLYVLLNRSAVFVLVNHKKARYVIDHSMKLTCRDVHEWSHSNKKWIVIELGKLVLGSL